MDIRLFQILVPLVTLGFAITLILRYKKGEAAIGELVLGLIFWVAITLISIFPDFISVNLAKALGFKSNINAILFFCIGLLFYWQFKLFSLIRKQDRTITQLIRELALKEEDEKQEK